MVEADPARTAKVLPSVAGRVVDLKVQLGARVAAGEVLAVIEFGDLAQAFSDLEKARSALTLTKQTLDRLLDPGKDPRHLGQRPRAGAERLRPGPVGIRAGPNRLQAIGAPLDQKGDDPTSVR